MHVYRSISANGGAWTRAHACPYIGPPLLLGYVCMINFDTHVYFIVSFIIPMMNYFSIFHAGTKIICYFSVFQIKILYLILTFGI
jgi:hypothetical protein